MKKNSKKDLEDLDEKNFIEIFNEIKRQFDIVMQTSDSQDTKIGILLGFVILALSQLLTIGDIPEYFLFTHTASVFFIIGIVSIIYSGYAGMMAYFLKKHEYGPSIEQLITHFRNREKGIKKIISKSLHKATQQISTTVNVEKAHYMKHMFVAFLFGFLFIMIARAMSLLRF